MKIEITLTEEEVHALIVASAADAIANLRHGPGAVLFDDDMKAVVTFYKI